MRYSRTTWGLLIITVIVLVVASIRLFERVDETSAESDAPTSGNDRPPTQVKPGTEIQSGSLSRADVEAEMGRAFTEEEAALKPPDVPWDAWAYSVGTHHLSAEQNGTIEFFGKIVSENGDPLSGVRLVAKIGASEPSFVKALTTGEEYNVKSIELVTDQNGEFEVTGLLGRRLTITDFEKPGYAIKGESEVKGMAPRKSWSYSFLANSPSSFQPDADNPEVFTMRKVE